jgi:hypothetical protein
MKPTLFRMLPLVSAWLFLCGELRAQTLDEVREVVESYFGPDQTALPARKRLGEWGNAALPPLTLLAAEPQRQWAWNLICAIGEVGTPESFDLLVTILDGKTRVPASQALNYLVTHVNRSVDPGLVGRLQTDPRFKPAIRRFATSGSWLERKFAAEVATEMNWPDFVPLLQQMLDDENAQLRKSAAAALSALTGRPVDAEPPSTSFPDVQLVPGLVSEPTSIESRPDSAMTWALLQPRPDGTSTFMIGDGRTFQAWPSIDDTDTRTFSVPALDALLLHPKGMRPQYVALSAESGFPGADAEEVISWSEDGNELWRYAPPQRGIGAAAILTDAEGPYGVALGPGSDTGLVGIDPHGKALWDVPKVHVLYGLETHPRLPGMMLVVHGQFSIVHHSRASIDADEVTGAFIRGVRRGDETLYAHEGLIYPAENGAPEVVVSGSGPHSAPVLSCFDASYSRKWKVSLAERVTQLALLEIEGRERLFVLTTAGGELLLLNQQGVLRWRGPLPNGEEDGDVFVLQLVTGIADGRALIALRCKQGLFVYAVRAELLAPTTR